MQIHQLTLRQTRDALLRKELSPVEIVQALADRIEKIDPKIGSHLGHDLETALVQARSADLALPLGGLPIALKDVISVQGQPLTAGSKMLAGYVAPYDSTATARLRAAGAIPFGRLNMDEFAMGSSTENSAWQPTRNPWDTTRIPGGSSGGSAAAVAADLALATLGSDTGGSIRQPAALCGCVGLKPTYGRISRYGLIAFASSLDQIGPFTKTVEDSALLLSALSGHDPRDSTSLHEPVPDYAAALAGVTDLKGLRVGLPKEYFIPGTDPQVSAAIQNAIATFRDLGAEIVEVSLPHTEYAVATYYIIATAEASANLARFDGVRYGHRAENPRDLTDHYLRSRAEGFGDEVKRRIILGTYVLSSGYHDAYYLQAQRVRTLIRRDFTDAFKTVDILLSPTSPTPAFKFGERTADPLQMYLSDIFTIAVNLAGTCALSLPCGLAQVDGKRLPVGLQLIGQPFQETRLLQAAHAYEKSTEWHKARPPLSA